MLNVDSKTRLADVKIAVDYTNGVQVNYTTSEGDWGGSINGVAINQDTDAELKCSLSVTEYGDMSSFIGQPGTWQGAMLANSTGYYELHTVIVEDFPCKGYKNGTAMPLNLTSSMTHDLDSLVGKGLLLTLAGEGTVLGYAAIHVDNGVPSFNLVFTDVIAVCQDPEKFALMLYSNVTFANTDQHTTLYAHY